MGVYSCYLDNIDFYPRSPCGERRPVSRLRKLFLQNFYPRSPCGERLINYLSQSQYNNAFLSTLSLRRATVKLVSNSNITTISIHALLAESDRITVDCYLESIISIHALLAESDRGQNPGPRKDTDFYPRSPCGERQVGIPNTNTSKKISIHALLAESDSITIITICTALRFLSTLSLRRATPHKQNKRRYTPYFYPRSPCGERQTTWLPAARQNVFLSTLSLRRATPRIFLDLTFHENFYPRSPCGERHTVTWDVVSDTDISIHALLAESDRSCQIIVIVVNNFYPRSPCGERLLLTLIIGFSGRVFLSTLSLRRATGDVLLSCLGRIIFLSTLSLRRATVLQS